MLMPFVSQGYRTKMQNQKVASRKMFRFACHVEMLPTTHAELRNATCKDPVLTKVFRYTLDGWPKQLSTEESDLKPFFRRRLEITIEQGIFMWGMRIIIPLKGQRTIMEE